MALLTMALLTVCRTKMGIAGNGTVDVRSTENTDPTIWPRTMGIANVTDNSITNVGDTDNARCQRLRCKQLGCGKCTLSTVGQQKMGSLKVGPWTMGIADNGIADYGYYKQ